MAATYNPAAVGSEAVGARLWVNDQMEYHAASDRGTAGFPASIFNGNQALRFASWGRPNYLFQGYQTYWFICGAYLREAEIYNIYETTKYLPGFVAEKGSSW